MQRIHAGVTDRAKAIDIPLGALDATPGALRALEANGVGVWDYLTQHRRGEWGALSDEDRRRNDDALVQGGRLHSAYVLPDGVKLWVITEPDRSRTTLLLPTEY